MPRILLLAKIDFNFCVLQKQMRNKTQAFIHAQRLFIDVILVLDQKLISILTSLYHISALWKLYFMKNVQFTQNFTVPMQYPDLLH